MELARPANESKKTFVRKPQPTTQKPRYTNNSRPPTNSRPTANNRQSTNSRPTTSFSSRINPSESKKFKELLDDLVGTRAAYLLDNKLNVLGKIPVSEIQNSIKNLKDTYAIVFDGVIDKSFVSNLDRSGIKYLVGMDSRINPRETRIKILSQKDLR